MEQEKTPKVQIIKSSKTYEKEQYNRAMDHFLHRFRNDMISFINKAEPNYRAVVAGGFGLKALLDTKYQLRNRINTKDFDLTISTYKSKWSFFEIYAYWTRNILKWINEQPRPQDFKVTMIDIGKEYMPMFDAHRNAIIMVTYRHQEFVDVVITDLKITKEMIDTASSVKSGIPVKKLDFYLNELLSLIYMENVSDVEPYVYQKRNPVDGYYAEKGRKDIDRAKLVCTISNSKQYKKYCDFIKSISIDDLKQMKTKERDRYFSYLQKLVYLQRKIYKKDNKNISKKAQNTKKT